MSRTLSELRGDVRQLLDDLESERFTSDTIINLAINRAATAVGRTLVDAGWPGIIQTTFISVTNGVATIPANTKIKQVYLSSDSVGTSLYPLRPGDNTVRVGKNTNSFHIAVDYAAKHVSPSTDGTTVTYCGIDVNDFIVDQLCAYIAADDLKTQEGSGLNTFKEKAKSLEADIMRARSGNMVVPAYPRYNSGYDLYRWFQTGPTTITIY